VIEKLGFDAFPALYFIYSRKLTEQLAHGLAKSDFGRELGNRANRSEIDRHLKAFNREHPGVVSRDLKRTLQKGIAFHHAGLHVALKALVEELYEERLLNVLYCTSTFALGINMPARTVIFDDVTKFNGVDIVPLSVREFMQMAGRAGRRGIDVEGDVVVKLDFGDWGEHQATLKHLMSGNSEPVRSSFNLSFNSVVNLLDRYDERTIQTLLERSFKAFQMGRRAKDLADTIDDVEPTGNRRERRKRAYLERELAEARRPLLWEQFQRKVSFLRTHGYVDANDRLLAAGRVCQQIQFAEIFVTELFMNGIFEDMSAEEIFGVMTGLVQSLPRTARVAKPNDEKWWAYFDAIGEVFESEPVWGAQELVGEETTFTPPLMPLGERWAHGDALHEILADVSNPTDLSGDLVGAFRRAKDLVGQLRNVVADDEIRRKELTAVLKAVSRDEVEVID
jgi:superfamily II RNA helicase